MTWWCFDRHKPDEVHDELARIERFLYSDQMKRHDNCRDDDGARDFTESNGGSND